MSTFAPHPLWDQGATPVRSNQASRPAQDLSGVADQFETALNHLRLGELTAGTELASTALTRMRSLLGDPDPAFRPAVFPVIAPERGDSESARVLDVSGEEFRRRTNGLIQRRLPLEATFTHARTGEVLSRLRFVPTVPSGRTADVRA